MVQSQAKWQCTRRIAYDAIIRIVVVKLVGRSLKSLSIALWNFTIDLNLLLAELWSQIIMPCRYHYTTCGENDHATRVCVPLRVREWMRNWCWGVKAMETSTRAETVQEWTRQPKSQVLEMMTQQHLHWFVLNLMKVWTNEVTEIMGGKHFQMIGKNLVRNTKANYLWHICKILHLYHWLNIGGT